LFVESKLQSRKGQVTEDGGFVPIEKGRESFLSDDGASCISCGTVVVSGVEKGIFVAPLQLEACFEDFRWHIDERCGEICEKALTKSAIERNKDIDLGYEPPVRYANCGVMPESIIWRLLYS